MTDVFVERHFHPPMTEAEMHMRMATTADGCYVIHRVDWRGSLLSADGAEMVCRFRAPDAESVRIALRQSGSQLGETWSCTVEDIARTGPADLARVNVLTEHRFDEPVEVATIRTLESSAASHLDGRQGCLVRMYISNDRRRMLCLYRAPDVESVRSAELEAGLPPDRIWAVRGFVP